jgi:L-seryl-tRNA(Ser) seleniumtransferase
MSGATVESTVRGSKAQRELPSVDRVMGLPGVASLVAAYGRTFVVAEVRLLLGDWRAERKGDAPLAAPGENAIAATLESRIAARVSSSLKPVFNLTGTVLHTNLGRALLADDAVDAVARAMRSAANLEFDLETGERGDRDTLVEGLLRELTGAEAATIVNNNAAAVLLTVAALASRREVIVSRGELVEIGGAFRMPDVMKCAGARLVEVGTTNRTHARDYADAIGARTALMMKVHTSNYAVQGFTAAVDAATLAGLAHERGVPFAVDLGSGSLVDPAAYGLPAEPRVQEAIAAGADIVTFSGDKLLGGPQAGLIVGKAEWIRKIKKHPLKRALRVSKMTLAALESTLALYRHPERLRERLPTLRILTRPAAEIEALARRIAPALSRAVAPDFDVAIDAVQSQIGSGSLPVDLLPSYALVLRPQAATRGHGRRLSALAASLRRLPVPVIGRIAENALVLDVRTLTDEDAFVAQLASLGNKDQR